jgi:hypothetical protein
MLANPKNVVDLVGADAATGFAALNTPNGILYSI